MPARDVSLAWTPRLDCRSRTKVTLLELFRQRHLALLALVIACDEMRSEDRFARGKLVDQLHRVLSLFEAWYDIARFDGDNRRVFLLGVYVLSTAEQKEMLSVSIKSCRR
jgi:hypothetical protein